MIDSTRTACKALYLSFYTRSEGDALNKLVVSPHAMLDVDKSEEVEKERDVATYKVDGV